ncbi:MAG: methyltransferase domain-containing protein [Acidimicrobiaceae bacterium]|nr:methyltransferase domain-containing protein [Acidimicrobiaceae bacterium]MBO0714137.1 methyltransferase domain-containing protein [Acidimicrobiales bacterium]
MGPPGEWETEAERWASWARTPGHDAYWHYRDHFFNDLLPPPGRHTVEIGCGEGRVARDLCAHGHHVTGIDSSERLLSYAREEDTQSAYIVADGAALPFRDGYFDLAVAYNSLQVVSDVEATVEEVARVLCPGGRFCACVAHPVTDLGRFVDGDRGGEFVLRGDYFARRRVEDRIERDGLEVTVRGWSYTLEDYAAAFERSSLLIETIREPRPSRGSSRYEPWQRAPMFLSLRARKA